GRGQRLAEAEEALLGFTHAELGATVAERWSYPHSLRHTIRDHEQNAPVAPVTAAVRLADLLTRERGMGVEPPDPDALAIADPVGAGAARAEPLLDALDRLESAPGDVPAAPSISDAALRTARAALGG
ncbi:MAG TPA: HDOD domain-containing protein, partial [Gaiellaceae bacterium]|nr:HDOD domain-containing protein [Gaiellaceae bacterium]